MSQRQKILIVDDSPSSLNFSLSLLYGIDADIVTASSGEEAIKKTINEDFDLILMDVIMPGIDGFETVQTIRKDGRNKLIPVIFITAISYDKLSIIKGLSLGAIDFIAKPIIKEILYLKITNLLEFQKDKKELEFTRNELVQKNKGLEILDIERKNVERKLLNAAQEWRNTFDSITDFIFVLDNNYKITRSNKAFAALFKMDPKKIIGKKSNELFHQEFQSLYEVELEKVKNNKTPITIELEEKNLELMLVLTISPILDEYGNNAATVNYLKDVTERKHAEIQIGYLLKEKEILLREVHHRIKNNMNTVSCLLQLQAASLKDESAINALNDAENRIHSMSILYDKLYRSNNVDITSLKEYLEALLNSILSTHTNLNRIISLEKHIDDISISATNAFSLGIIINELLTNAIKHAFNEMDKGTITILASKKDDKIVIVVQDDGIGMPEEVTIKDSKWFGLGLVDMMIEKSRGTISLERKNGTKFVIELPM